MLLFPRFWPETPSLTVHKHLEACCTSVAVGFNCVLCYSVFLGNVFVCWLLICCFCWLSLFFFWLLFCISIVMLSWMLRWNWSIRVLLAELFIGHTVFLIFIVAIVFSAFLLSRSRLRRWRKYCVLAKKDINIIVVLHTGYWHTCNYSLSFLIGAQFTFFSIQIWAGLCS